MASSRKRPRADLEVHLLGFLKQHQAAGRRLLLGFSGGLDSRVLLYLLGRARQGLDFELSAIHINHHISPNADHWAEFCASLCNEAKVPFSSVVVDVPRDTGLGLEAAAREARYRVLFAQDADALVLAHHQDDQAETLLLQLLRGAGVKGLAAMGETSYQQSAISSQQKPIWRPLLSIARAELREYANQHELHWIEDESNLDMTYDRNYLRCHVMPLLESRFPATSRTLARSASHLAEAAALLEELAREDAGRTVHEDRLDLSLLKAMTAARATNLLRYWLLERSRLALSKARLDDIRSQLLNSRPDARVRIKIGDFTLSRRRGMAVIE
jgi:tRNA(Ile)-lysidine synthase